MRRQGDDRHGHVTQTHATAVDKRLHKLKADGRRSRSFSTERKGAHGQDNSQDNSKGAAGHAFAPASLPRPPPEWKTHGAFSASCPQDLQQAKGRRDKIEADDRHGHVTQTRATAVDKRLQQLKADGRRSRSFSPARTNANGQDTSRLGQADNLGKRPENQTTRGREACAKADGREKLEPYCGLHDKGNAYELALWRNREETFRRHSVSSIDLVKMREAARVPATPATAPHRDERPSAPLQAVRANMMRSPVELASRVMHIVVVFFFAVVSFLTLMLPSFSALTSPLWGPRSKLADSQWQQRAQRARGSKPLCRSASASASSMSAKSESVPLGETGDDDDEHYGCDKGYEAHRRALTSEWASFSKSHYPNQCQRRAERIANFLPSGTGFDLRNHERALTF